VALDPTYLHLLVRERVDDLIREAEAERLVNEALAVQRDQPARPRRQLALPFFARLALPLLGQRRKIAL